MKGERERERRVDSARPSLTSASLSSFQPILLPQDAVGEVSEVPHAVVDGDNAEASQRNQLERR